MTKATQTPDEYRRELEDELTVLYTRRDALTTSIGNGTDYLGRRIATLEQRLLRQPS